MYKILCLSFACIVSTNANTLFLPPRDNFAAVATSATPIKTCLTSTHFAQEYSQFFADFDELKALAEAARKASDIANLQIIGQKLMREAFGTFVGLNQEFGNDESAKKYRVDATAFRKILVEEWNGMNVALSTKLAELSQMLEPKRANGAFAIDMTTSRAAGLPF